MLNVELNMEYFEEKAQELDKEGVYADTLYTDFVDENILLPLGFRGYSSDDQERVEVTIHNQKTEIDVFRNEELSVYDIYNECYKHRYVVSLQRKSIVGHKKIDEVIAAIRSHEAVMEITEDQLFFF